MRISRALTPDDRAANLYFDVPFEVGRCESVEVLLDYDRSRAVIDLGCMGPDGWRGWSGGAKKRFVITRTAASTGYCPGELETGVWKVVLGLHQIPAEGVTVELTIVNVASGPADWKMPPPSPSVELSLIVEFLTVNELPTLMPPPAHDAELPTMLELRTVIGALARMPPP